MTATQILLMISGIFLFVSSITYIIMNIIMGAAGEATDDHPFILSAVLLFFSIMLMCMSGVR